MMSHIRLFWWSPRRMPRTLFDDFSSAGEGWARLFLQNGRTFTNFGDELSKRVVEECTGRRVKWSNPAKAELLAVGSVLDFYSLAGASGADVWGSGLKHGAEIVSDTSRFGR